VEYIKSRYPRLKLIQNQSHQGFAIANNQGIAAAKGEFLLFLNNDTWVTKDFLYPLVKRLKTSQSLGAVQPKIRLIENPDYLDDVVTYLTPLGILYHLGFKEKDCNQFDKAQLTFSAKGACFLVKKEVLEKVGPFDERFYCYFEESDLCWRIWLNGWQIVFEPESLIYHEAGGMLSRRNKAFRNYFSIKNRLNSLIKNLSFPFLVLVLPAHFSLLLGLTFFYIIKGELGSVGAILRATVWNLSELGETLRRRKWVQTKVRKVGDLKLFKKVGKVPSPGYFFRFLNLYEQI